MSARRRALLHLVLGAWLAIGLGTTWVAVLSFEGTERAPAGAPATRERADASAFNARLFAGSGRAQIVLGGAAVLLAAWPRRASGVVAACVGLAALLAAVIALVLTPRIAGLAPIEGVVTGAEALASLGRLHGIAASLDLARSLLVGLAIVLDVRAAGRAFTPPTG